MIVDKNSDPSKSSTSFSIPSFAPRKSQIVTRQRAWVMSGTLPVGTSKLWMVGRWQEATAYFSTHRLLFRTRALPERFEARQNDVG